MRMYESKRKLAILSKVYMGLHIVSLIYVFFRYVVLDDFPFLYFLVISVIALFVPGLFILISNILQGYESEEEKRKKNAILRQRVQEEKELTRQQTYDELVKQNEKKRKIEEKRRKLREKNLKELNIDNKTKANYTNNFESWKNNNFK